MNESKRLKQVWKWKEEVYQKTKNMTRDERIRYFNDGLKDFVKKTGIKKITEKRAA
ncbi:MAG: hypothetical protein HZB81_03815 [Deltaproteobacteria bacterium]|nr:hypothetical protein [Deltaproteobacteria bacterium]